MTSHLRSARRAALLLTAGLCTVVFAAGPAAAAEERIPSPSSSTAGSRSCPPAGTALGFSDALDKID